MNRNKNIFLKIFLLLMLIVAWGGGAWAQSASVATGIYRIAASYSDDRGIIIDKGGNYVTVSKNQYNTGITAADNNNSLWYVYQCPNGCYLIASLSYYSGRNNDVYFLKGAGANTSYQSNAAVEWNFTFKTNSNRTGNNTSGFDTTPAKADYFEIALASNPTRYLKSTPGYSNEADKLRLDSSEPAASYLEFQSRNESVLSNDQKALLARIDAKIQEYLLRFTKLPDGTKLRFEDTSHNIITSTSTIVKYTPVGGGNPVELSSSNTTYDFHDVLFTPSAFSGSFNYNIEAISYDKATSTLTFTLVRNKWYKMRVANVNAYVSSDYADDQGMLLQNSTNQPNPTTYAGIWRSVSAEGVAANSDGTNVKLYNAMYYDTKLLAMTKPANDGQARGAMFASGDIPSGAATVFEQRIKSDQTDSYYFRITGTGVNTNTYINQRNPYFSNWTNGGYGGSGSRFIFEVVPELGNNVSIVINGESGNVTYNTQCVALTGENNITLTNGAHYDFKNMPYLASLFKATDYDKRISAVDFNEGTQTLTFTLIKLHAIKHRQHELFTQVEAVDAEHKPNNKFIQPGKGLIDHPNKNNFTGASYTDNDRKMQNTSVFHITQYAKKGGTTNVALPHTRTGGTGTINKYQRIYDYTTERCLDDGILQGLSGYTTYYNGIAKAGVSGSLTIKLPKDKDEIYVGVDDSEFNDFSPINSNSDLTEPSLSMRTIIHVVSAEKMAESLDEIGGEKWFEEKTYIVPNIKRGSATHRNNSDLLPLDMPFSNYWIYDNSHNPMRIVAEGGNYNTLTNNLSIEIEGSAASYITADIFKDANGPGLHGPLGVAYNHFIYYKVNGDGLTREVPAGSQAIIKLYAHNGASGTKYQLAKFTLNFQADCEPLAITSVVGNPASTRSRDYFNSQKMAEVASLTFSEKKVGFKGFGGVGGNDTHYAFPLDPTRTSYAFSPDDAFGGYRITKSAYGMKALPVSLYERNIKNQSSSLTVDDDDYYLYIDAAEAPGQVASIPLDGNLCAGTRLFFYGWLNSQNPFESGNATAASVILELVGRKDGKDMTLATYLPGVVSDAAYTPEGGIVRSVDNGNTASDLGAYSSSYTIGDHTVATRIAAWQSIGFSYLLTESGFDGFELRVINNCYSTAGGDYSLDDFRVFVNPPKGSVDFTTPLCSDKVRHAKIHAEYDMLKNKSGVNDDPSNTDPNMYVTCCFLEAKVFDDNTKIGDEQIFEIDAQGNHNLKEKFSHEPQLTQAKNLINAAFGKALVGTRELSAGDKKDHGFHVYAVSQDYESIPVYAYNDSKIDEVYREEVGGIRRIVFKEDVVREEQDLLPDGRWPHMRPSTEYYLVFSPIKATKGSDTAYDIDHHATATDIFLIHESCSFFGKFTTKDPMHVILDNADIEADLPITAVCHGETTQFSFNMPALKLDKPIVDEAYCISDQSLDGKIAPESQGTHHYKYEASFKTDAISGVIKNLPYDWWLGGKYDETHSYRGTIEDYLAATHPTRTYSGPKDIAHKQDGALVKIAQAMEDFRFYYPDFGKNGGTLDWSTVTKKDYNSDTGYGLLDSEINTIKDFVDAGIIILHRNTYDMPLTYEEAEELQAKELSDMMEKEMNDQILELALKLNTDPAVAALLPLKALEGTVLGKLSLAGKKRLTFEEFGSFTREQLVDIAGNLQTHKAKLTELTSVQINAMQEGELRRVVESALRELPDDDMLGFAKDYFPNIGHEKRAYLVVRALNILSRETVAKLPEADQQNTTKVRAKLREQMISIFSAQDERVLRKMWADASAKLTAEERAELLKDAKNPGTPKDPSTMGAAGLAVLVEDGLAQLTNNVINDLSSDRYVHFTLVPIMPSQETFVDEPYIFCPEPRGVKLRITSHSPRMLDGFADMPYPEDMENVPVRLGLPQIRETKGSASKTLRIPVRGLKQAAKDGVKAVKLEERTGYYTSIFLVKTDDPQYQQTENAGVLSEAKNSEGMYTRMVGTIKKMVANYPTSENKTPDNYLDVWFDGDMNFREGYTYRVGINFMEHNSKGEETISCPGEMRLDMKIVPEYQKWTASVNNDWTNDKNWARASRAELNAGNAAAGNKIDDTATALDDASSYIDNDGDGGNGTVNSFVPMYFSNVLFAEDAAPALYTEKETDESEAYTPASRSGKTFLKGMHSTATDRIVYDMEVVPADGKGTWPVSEGDYECGLFGTYIANGITFLPGSQLVNAHFLDYKKAWVEYELTPERWYTLSSPLQNTFAGEWYSPTDGGRQVTPHFYGIEYDHERNHRFQPAYYQRSWDNEGNNLVYLKQGGEFDAYVRADWSFVYNDVTKEYSEGGFSVKASDGFMEHKPSNGKVLVRMPKADAKYTYYDKDNQTGAKPDDVLDITEGRYRLWSDKVKDGETFTQTIKNKTEDNNFFLVGNPFMANMDMDAFFAANPGLEKKFWIMTEEGQKVSVKVDGDLWIGTDGTVGKVAPLQGFFVKGTGNTVSVTFSADMQKASDNAANTPVYGTRAASVVRGITSNMVRLSAERNGAKSAAVIMLSDNAKDEYVAGEDCEVFIDENLYDRPTVYTSADAMAQTINVRKSLNMVPVGMISSDDSEAVLTFDLGSYTSDALYLYDSSTDSYTEIEDGTSVTMSGNNAGRYYLTTIATNLDELTAQEEAQRKGVWTVSGIYRGESIKGLPSGVYIVDGVKMLIK